MAPQPVAFPLHQFRPDADDVPDFCAYTIGGQQCGHSEAASVHNVVKVYGGVPVLGTTLPADNFTSPEWQMPHVHQPSFPTNRCKYIGRDGKPCGLIDKAGVHSVVAQAPRRMRYETLTGVLELDDPPTTLQGLIVFFDQCVGLADEKDQAYGGAWRAQGYMGNLARIMSKVQRLRNMLWSDEAGYGQGYEETVGDTLRDLANLAGFMERNYVGGNRWGR